MSINDFQQIEDSEKDSLNQITKENDPNGKRAFQYFLDGKNFFTFDCDNKNTNKLNIFDIMVERPICATYDNFMNAFKKWKEQKYIDVVRPRPDKIKNINKFTKMVANIRFMKTEREKLINKYQDIIIKEDGREKKYKKEDGKYEPTIMDAVYLFPFISHIYVDYYIDLISPLENLKILSEKIKNQSNQLNQFCQNIIYYFAISYIWKVLNVTEDFEITEFPFDDPKCELEVKIFFQKDILKKEVAIKHFDEAIKFSFFGTPKPKINLLSKSGNNNSIIPKPIAPRKSANKYSTIPIPIASRKSGNNNFTIPKGENNEKSESNYYRIPKVNVYQMIKYLFSGDQSYLKFDDIIQHDKINCYKMIARICYHIILFIKKHYASLEKEFHESSQKVSTRNTQFSLSKNPEDIFTKSTQNLFPESSQKVFPKRVFKIMCDIASTPYFVDDEKHFKCTSFLLQLLIENGEILDKEYIKSAPKVLLSYAVKGPPFFSSNKSREIKKKFVKSINKNVKFSDSANNLKNCLFYSCYPSLGKENIIDPNKEPIKYKISKSIELNYNKNNEDIRSLFDFQTIENNQNNTNNQNNANNQNITNEQNIDKMKNQYLIEVTPYFLFQEMKIPNNHNNNNSDSKTEKNQNIFKFDEYLRELISNDKSNNICNGLSYRYILNNADDIEKKGNYQIFEVESNDPTIKPKLNEKIKKLKDLFRWHILQFLIEVDHKNSNIILHIDESNTKCKKLFVKYFILSRKRNNRDSELTSLIQYKGHESLLKGITENVKKYCKEYKLMYSLIALINPKDTDEKLNVLINYLTEILQDEKINKINAIEVLDLAVKQIKYKPDENGKKSAVLNQMCKKIFNVFYDLFDDRNINAKINDVENTDFVLQLFTSFAYETIDIIQTKSALKRIKKFIEKLSPKQLKTVILSLFNFFEGRRLQREHIFEILSNDQVNLAKQNSIESNSGHLYEFHQSICFNCKENVASNPKIGFVQFFNCGHIFHIYNCTGIRKNTFYKKCPVCPNDQNRNVIKKNRRKNKLSTHKNPYFDYFFNLRDNRFHNAIDQLPSIYETMKFPTCISDPPISVKVNYDDVDSFFNSNDDLIINFNERDP